MHCLTAADARPGLIRVVRAAINVANSFAPKGLDSSTVAHRLCTISAYDRSHTLLTNALYSSAPAFRPNHRWKNFEFHVMMWSSLNNKPFVKSKLLWYKSHNTISIPKQFIRNNVQQGECLTQSLQIWIWPSTQITLFEWTRQSAWLDAVTTPLIRSEWILVYSNISFWMELSNQKYRQKPPEMHSPTRY